MKAETTMGSADRKTGEDRSPQRVPRTTEHGPIGFAHVMAHTKAAAKSAHRHGAAAGSAAAVHAAVERDARSGKGLGKGAKGSTSSTTTDGDGQDSQVSVFGMDISHLFSAGALPTAGAPKDMTVDAAVNQHNAVDGQQQQTLTTQGAIRAIAETAQSMRSTNSIRELRIQLEPEHLGPLVVKMKLDGSKLSAELHVSSAEAAAKLRTGSAGLRDRLAAMGYDMSEVTITEQRKEYFDDVE